MIDMCREIAQAIADLTEANWLTGQWDNERFQLCKKEYNQMDEFDKKYLYTTEKNSRRNVELRAAKRKIIEDNFQKLINT